jgi:hypothetical protein
MDKQRFAGRFAPGLWVCAIAFLLTVLLVWPALDGAINDDWSVARTAEVFANTGHIHYNGWEAPMLLWEVWAIGLVMKLFGFSYAAVRATTIFHALIAVALLHECCIRSGLTRAQSVFATLVVTLSPIFLGCAMSGMTDMYGLLGIITCYYGAVRAVQASSTRSAAGWLIFASLSNLLLSTARQVDFIGAFLIVPGAVYLLRKQRSLVIVGAVLVVFSFAFAGGLLHWFNHQPYILPQEIISMPFGQAMVTRGLSIFAYAVMDSGLLIFPAFLLLWRAWKKPSAWSIAGFVISAAVFAFCHYAYNKHHVTHLLAPFFLLRYEFQTPENTFNSMLMPPKGVPPVLLPLWPRLIFTALSCAAIGTLVLAALRAFRLPQRTSKDERLPWRDLLALTVPTLAAYMVLQLPRGFMLLTLDRYLLGFFPLGIILLLRFSNRYFDPQIPRIAYAALAVLGAYSILTLHDAFATFRGNIAVIQQMRTAGIPRQRIDGGWEYNLETEVLAKGYTDAGGMTRPGGKIFQPRNSAPKGPCGEFSPLSSPSVHAEYAISWPDSPCTRVTSFAPVPYTTWLPPFHRQLYVVKAPPNQWIPID